MQGRKIIVTRPRDQGETLVNELSTRGAQVSHLPLLAIEPCRVDPSESVWAEQSFDWLVFTSANAVRYLPPGLLEKNSAAGLASIGPGTTAALQKRGHPPDFAPITGLSSEALVAQLEIPAGQSVLVISGEGGRQKVPFLLEEAGVTVAAQPVYRRIKLPLTLPAWHTALSDCDALLISSGEALQHLLNSLPDELLPSLRTTQLVVPSKRVVQLPACAEFESPPWVPTGMSDQAVIALLDDAFETI